ncbi:MAG: HlyD family efflux transporter periplasmic adaptor subunit [Prevotella sp.]|jgi:HlyD family secretion protein|nr:HlyD family efflux transporter periplasmic adaptor subunit [Prevotella sp.]MCI1517997.1 HlyD family efflux transporter periplasmic adaptor subunit [Prevotella sp.]MCI1549650.1 HlyD family efflux transporter periplasmic adaptor subunit [Prevotella sp.]MCI1595841.1 HlyD family efflux transporter periplasmic adaptor subunit [Prevotella sp.]MCI2125917.1 HlyD family efflux transporter periplasmic adaptor subunit [Prevotella sp.]
MNTPKILILAVVATLAACGRKDKGYDATGTFEATEVTVSAEQNGQLMQFNAEEGSQLRKGQQVGLIDTVQLALKARQLGATMQSIACQRPDVRTQIAVTRQQLIKAEQEQERFEKLVKGGAANSKQLDDAASSVRVLRRQLAAQISSLSNNTRALNSQISATDIQKYQILDQLMKCHIVSPIDGTVLEKYTEQGEFATIGKPLFKIADIKHIFLRAYLTSRQLEKVRIGQRVKVMADYGDQKRRTYEGTVTWISASSEFTPKTILTDDERADLVYAVKIAVINDGYIKIGMYGEMKL